MAQQTSKPENRTEDTDADPEVAALDRLEAFDGDDHAPIFRGELPADQLEMLSRHFVSLLDTVALKATDDGLYYREANSGNTAMGELYLPPTEWQTFDCLASGSGGLPLSDFHDIARRFGTDTVEVSTDSKITLGNGDVSLAVSDGSTFGGIERLADPPASTMTPDRGEFNYRTTATLTDGNLLREFAKEHGKTDDSAISVTVSIPPKRAELDGDGRAAVTFDSEADGVDPLVAVGDDLEDGVSYTGDIDYDGYGVSGDVDPDVGDAHEGNIVVTQSYYTAEYFRRAFGKLRKRDTKGVAYTVELASPGPLRLTRELPTGGHVRFLLAPRINQD